MKFDSIDLQNQRIKDFLSLNGLLCILGFKSSMQKEKLIRYICIFSIQAKSDSIGTTRFA